jgi:cell division protein FtsW (lipid II flippase)
MVRPGRSDGFRCTEWIVVAVAVLSALLFAGVAVYVMFLFAHSWAGLPWRYVAMLAVPFCVAVAASLMLATLEGKRRRSSW